MTKNTHALKDQQEQIFITISEMLGAISSPVRLRLIHFLSQGPQTVEVLAHKIEQSLANTSMHLRKMLSAQIVEVRTKGKNRVYSLQPAVFSFWETCQDFSLAINPSLELKVDEDINWKEDLKTTVKLLKEKSFVLIDARPLDESSEDISELDVLRFDPTNLQKEIAKFNKKKSALVFCRGRLCVLSSHIVHELRKNGIKAYRLNQSWYSLKRSLS